MKDGTIEVKLAFAKEPQHEELEKDIANVVAQYGYELVTGAQSLQPGVKESLFVKKNLKARKSNPQPPAPKSAKKKVAKKKTAKKKTAKKVK